MTKNENDLTNEINKTCMWCKSKDDSFPNPSIAYLRSKLYTKDIIFLELILKSNNDPGFKKIIENNYCCDDAKKMVAYNYCASLKGEKLAEMVRKFTEKEINDHNK